MRERGEGGKRKGREGREEKGKGVGKKFGRRKKGEKGREREGMLPAYFNSKNIISICYVCRYPRKNSTYATQKIVR